MLLYVSRDGTILSREISYVQNVNNLSFSYNFFLHLFQINLIFIHLIDWSHWWPILYLNQESVQQFCSSYFWSWLFFPSMLAFLAVLTRPYLKCCWFWSLRFLILLQQNYPITLELLSLKIKLLLELLNVEVQEANWSSSLTSTTKDVLF